ncbi:hypothetical protein E4U58_000637 [Claviceps cyperi]|nr:hypothetical protein E4U58_000637 [Claviceps cyperi]
MVPHTMAGFASSSAQGIAVYWGKNSYGQGSGPLAQQRLGQYCANSDIGIVSVAFMNGITPPITNFANAGDNCTAFPGAPNVLKCPQIEEDIKQSAGSGFLGGAVSYLDGGSATTAVPSGTTPTTSSSAASPTKALIPQWGQCGGRSWTGATECTPFKCTVVTEWFSHCQ